MEYLFLRSRKKLRMIRIFIWMAGGLFNTLDNIATPNSVNTHGWYLSPPLLRFQFETSKNGFPLYSGET